MEKLFTQSEITKIFKHIPGRTLHSWCEAGMVAWSSEYEDRRGKHRKFSIVNLYQFGLVEIMLELKIPSKAIQGFMEFIFHVPEESWQTSVLIFNKVKEMKDDKYSWTDKDGKKTIVAYKVPGFHGARLVPMEANLYIIDQELIQNSSFIIAIPLPNIMEKVDDYLRASTI